MIQNEDRFVKTELETELEIELEIEEYLDRTKQLQLIKAALDLYDAGLNVFPIIQGKKEPYGTTKVLHTTRILRQDLASLVSRSNIAVMTGRNSNNLFILDCDSAADFESYGEKLNALGIHPRIRLGSKGGQYWMYSSAGEVNNTKIGATDVLGNHHYSVAPPSIHPTGVTYVWKCKDVPIPSVDQNQLGKLGLTLKSYCRKEVNSSGDYLPSIARQVLEDRDTDKYKSHSEAEFAACLSMIGSGMSDSDIVEIFQKYNPPHFAKVGESRFQKHVLEKAREHHQPLRHDHQKIPPSSDYRNQALQRPWPGRTGSTDRSVYLAVCSRYEMEGKETFRASCREVAELAGITSQTACRSLYRLTKKGYILKQGTDETSAGNSYSLVDLPAVVPARDISMLEINTLEHTGGDYVLSVLISSTSHDVWSGRALGKSAAFCYQALLTRMTERSAESELTETPQSDTVGMTVSELVKSTGKVDATVRRALNRLENHGLVTEQSGQWLAVRKDAAGLDEIAETLGKTGTGVRRAERHDVERQIRASDIIARTKNRWFYRRTSLNSTYHAQGSR